jgi:hypothetical protein
MKRLYKTLIITACLLTPKSYNGCRTSSRIKPHCADGGGARG